MGFNIEFLNIRQSRESFLSLNWLNMKDAIERNKIGLKLTDFDNNKHKLKKILKSKLKNASIVYTHNPWGDYGHIEHIQVFKIINEIRQLLNFQIFVTGYVSNLTENYSSNFTNLLFKKPTINKTNIAIYKQFKNVYLKNNCWTWFKDYKLPKYEYFYKVKKKQESNFNYTTVDRKLNYIFMGNIYFIIIKRLIKSLIPPILKNSLRNLIT